MVIDYTKLSEKIFDLDSQVRFAGVVNNKGELIAGGQKNDLKKILSDDDVKMAIHYALQKRELFTNLAYKIGNETSSITEYDIVTMIGIPINQRELFLISTEPRADYLKIIDYVRIALDSQKNSE
ncbi:MAG: hypothetical protein CXT78_05120 [Thaumarchaeota archaeon]|nr:MAG: hypothetical protein CXT78_05120 [Nitrososphaerota archaeon]